MRTHIMDFTDKVVVVTGASSGIGAAAATLLASNGAKLTLIGRNDTKLEKVAAECKSFKGHHPLCLALDLTQMTNCEAAIEKTVETFGKINVLVNAASKVMVSTMFDNNIDVFDEMMAIHVRVPYRLTQLALPHLIKTKGNVVNVAYSLTRRWKRGMLPYAIAKNALERFSKLAAAELNFEGVRMNVISPGWTKANLMANLNTSKSCSEYIYQTLKKGSSTNVLMEPSEIAILVCLAASDVFPSMNGSNFIIDGAASMM